MPGDPIEAPSARPPAAADPAPVAPEGWSPAPGLVERGAHGRPVKPWETKRDQAPEGQAHTVTLTRTKPPHILPYTLLLPGSLHSRAQPWPRPCRVQPSGCGRRSAW